MTNRQCDISKNAYLKKHIDEQFVWQAEVNAGQCHDRLLDAQLRSTVLMEDSGTHVCILTSLTEPSHLMVLCQLVVDLHQHSSRTADRL